MTTDETVSGHVVGHLLPGGTPASEASALVRMEQHRSPQAVLELMRLPEATPDEAVAVRQVLSLVGHVIDNGIWDELSALVVDDVEVQIGTMRVVGRADVVAWLTQWSQRPSHHTVNTLVRRDGDGLVALSRLVTIAGDGSVASADAVDRLAEQGGGWRLVHRDLQPRHPGATSSAGDDSDV